MDLRYSITRSAQILLGQQFQWIPAGLVFVRAFHSDIDFKKRIQSG